MSDLFQRLKGDFQDDDYRHIYTNGLIDSKIATQIKVLREQPERVWTQQVLAERTGMRQARISALEDVNYSSWSLSTLRRLARAFDLYVDVEFKEFGTLKPQMDELDREHLSRRSFRDDPVFRREQEYLPEGAAESMLSGSGKQEQFGVLPSMAAFLAERVDYDPFSSQNGLVGVPKKPPMDVGLGGLTRAESGGNSGSMSSVC